MGDETSEEQYNDSVECACARDCKVYNTIANSRTYELPFFMYENFQIILNVIYVVILR